MYEYEVRSVPQCITRKKIFINKIVLRNTDFIVLSNAHIYFYSLSFKIQIKHTTTHSLFDVSIHTFNLVNTTIKYVSVYQNIFFSSFFFLQILMFTTNVFLFIYKSMYVANYFIITLMFLLSYILHTYFVYTYILLCMFTTTINSFQ